jgi:uncharacterized phiE125 gp8 family phage protein
MHWSREVVTPPTVEPLTLAEAKDQARVPAALTADDTYIERLIRVARETVEYRTGRQLLTSTWDVYFDSFPEVLLIPYPPVQSVTTIKYLDSDGVQQTLSDTLYDEDLASQPARITPAYNESWPSIRTANNAVVVRCISGYGDAATDVPEQLRHAVALLVAHLYNVREPVTVGAVAHEIPDTLAAMIDVDAVLLPY